MRRGSFILYMVCTKADTNSHSHLHVNLTLLCYEANIFLLQMDVSFGIEDSTDALDELISPLQSCQHGS